MNHLNEELAFSGQLHNPLLRPEKNPLSTDVSVDLQGASVMSPDSSKNRGEGHSDQELGQSRAVRERETAVAQCVNRADPAISEEPTIDGTDVAPAKPRLKVESWSPVCATAADGVPYRYGSAYVGTTERVYEVGLEGGGKGLLLVDAFSSLKGEGWPFLEVLSMPSGRADRRPLLPRELRDEIEAVILNQSLGYLLAAWAPFAELRSWLAGLHLGFQPLAFAKPDAAGKQPVSLGAKLTEAANVALQCLENLAPSGWICNEERRALVQDELDEVCTLLCALDRGLKKMAKAAYGRGRWGALEQLAGEAGRYRRNMVKIRDEIKSVLDLLGQC